MDTNDHKKHEKHEHVKSHDADHVTISKQSIVTILLSVVVIISLVNVYSTWTLHSKFEALTGGPIAAPTPTGGVPLALPPSVPVEASADDDAVRGDPDAPITIIEFSDYECPFCARFYSETLGLLEQNYIDTGKVNLVYRDFPLSFHPSAQKAAEAAECAGEQGEYYEMHDMLFESGVAGGVAQFKQYAATLGLDTGAFNSCLDSGAMEAEVQKDMADGSAAGVSGTPSFVINGELLVGAQPFAAFKQVIDRQLAAQ